MSAIDTSILEAIRNCLLMDSKVVAFECTPPSADSLLSQIEQDFVGRVKVYSGAVEGLTGLALGAAIAGLKPILKFDSSAQFITSYQFFSDIAAKLPTISNANLDAPLVVLCPSGPGLAWGIEHDNVLESIAAKIEGLDCYFASGASDIAAVLNDALTAENPALILYSPLSNDFVDPTNYNGKDLAVLAWGHNHKRAQLIAKMLHEENNVELTVLNLQKISPFDKEEILKAVSHTHKVVIISDGSSTTSFGCEIAAFIQKEALDELDAPVLTLPYWYVPSRYLPSYTDFDEKFTGYCLDAIRGMLSDRY